MMCKHVNSPSFRLLAKRRLRPRLHILTSSSTTFALAPSSRQNVSFRSHLWQRLRLTKQPALASPEAHRWRSKCSARSSRRSILLSCGFLIIVSPQSTTNRHRFQLASVSTFELVSASVSRRYLVRKAVLRWPCPANRHAGRTCSDA